MVCPLVDEPCRLCCTASQATQSEARARSNPRCDLDRDPDRDLDRDPDLDRDLDRDPDLGGRVVDEDASAA
jgi:hypothetical protein